MHKKGRVLKSRERSKEHSIWVIWPKKLKQILKEVIAKHKLSRNLTGTSTPAIRLVKDEDGKALKTKENSWHRQL